MRRLAIVALALLASACGGGTGPVPVEPGGDPPAVAVGERLFLETRFAQFFAANARDVNTPLASGDPVLDTLPNPAGDLRGPFRGQSMNCRQCHLVDEGYGLANGGMRSYGDFARRSHRPDRGLGVLTVRNSPPLVEASVAPGIGGLPLILHFDAEFTNTDDLVRGAMTGAMFGWLPGERAQAVAQIARVIREDDGRGALAAGAGGSYRAVLSGTSGSLTLPAEYRINVSTASDQQLLDAVAKLVSAYLDGLRYLRNGSGAFIGSPFDLFLGLNRLPAQPATAETAADYTARLRGAVAALARPEYVAPDYLRRFQFHAQPFQFGEQELRGLRIFLAEPAAGPTAAASADELASGGIGNCAGCHRLPRFTDGGLHNTGATQREYDAVHGAGAFAALPVPTLAQRADPATAANALPATAAHPDYAGRFRAIPEAGDAGKVDLGAWNIVANPDMAANQPALRAILCAIQPAADCAATDDAALLDRAIATFKTPTLRDLADSQPYLHDGNLDTLDEVIAFYAAAAAQARAGTLRNADPRLAGIALNAQDQADLAAFLRALDEDYN